MHPQHVLTACPHGMPTRHAHTECIHSMHPQPGCTAQKRCIPSRKTNTHTHSKQAHSAHPVLTGTGCTIKPTPANGGGGVGGEGRASSKHSRLGLMTHTCPPKNLLKPSETTFYWRQTLSVKTSRSEKPRGVVLESKRR